jgi:hydroxymethylpyrimidine/phosphomethylpyrimidine kinase
MIPKVLTIAGSDSSGAAGVQADLKTYEARGVYGLSALTLVTAQDSTGIQALHTLPPEFVAAQIESVLQDMGANAVKTGLLLRADVIRMVAQKMNDYQVQNLIVDPVMVAGDGRRLLNEEADHAYIHDLFPRALIITPNLDEAQLLTGKRVQNMSEMMIAAEMLRQMGPRYVLIKGGHIRQGDEVIDLLYDGDKFEEFRGERLPTWNARGTGCTFASCIAAEVAKGRSVVEACATAKTYVAGALRAAADWKMGRGRGTVYHGFEHTAS